MTREEAPVLVINSDFTSHLYIVSNGIIIGIGDSWEAAFADADRREKGNLHE